MRKICKIIIMLILLSMTACNKTGIVEQEKSAKEVESTEELDIDVENPSQISEHDEELVEKKDLW